MTEAVTDVIVARGKAADELRPMVLWSLGAHAALLMLAVLIPALGEPSPPRARMTIVLSAGAPGPDTGGRTPIGGRRIEQAAPAEAPRLVETPPPSPPAPPEATVPEPKPRPRAETRKPEPPKVPPKPAASASSTAKPTTAPKPSTGEQPREGSTNVETQAQGTGSGLSSGGGSSASSAVELDVTDFCCPEYISRMVSQIKLNWIQQQGMGGRSVVVKFTIQRDGTIEDVRVDRRSGVPHLDRAAERAVLVTAQLPRLPQEFSNPTLTIRLTFEY